MRKTAVLGPAAYTDYDPMNNGESRDDAKLYIRCISNASLLLAEA